MISMIKATHFLRHTVGPNWHTIYIFRLYRGARTEKCGTWYTLTRQFIAMICMIKATRFLRHISIKLEFSGQIFEKITEYQIS
jgi:hypothetical protein